MPQQPWTSALLIQALHNLGLREGDLVFVHSDLRSFGIPAEAKTTEDILLFYYEGFKAVLGATGTLAVPAYFYEFARYGEPFDTETSPVSKSLGVFSSYINALPGRVRSLSPLQSFAAIGMKAQELCGGNSLTGYGILSPWHQLRMLGGKIVFLGTTMQPMTYVHHIEQQYGVPHLYTKIYPYPLLRGGIPIPGQAISTVRFLDYAIEYDLLPFQAEMGKRGLLQVSSLGKATLYAVDAEETFQLGIDLLKQNPYCFLKRPPAFVCGKIPLDGILKS